MMKGEEGMLINTNRTCESRSGRSRVAAWYCTYHWDSLRSCFLAMDRYANTRQRSGQVRSEVFTVCQHKDCLFT
jgi:hypothetical protein